MLQLPNHKTVFGLRDNPFSPGSIEGVNGLALDGISSYPLALDDEPGLLPLFVPSAGPFQEHIDRFDAKLDSGGYTSNRAPARGSSLVFRVIGPEGSGKSTLTNMLVGRLKGCAPGKNLEMIKREVRPQTLEETLTEVRRLASDSPAEGCCLILEEVRIDMEDRIHELYEELRQTMTVVLFEIVHHANDIRGPRRLSERVYAIELRTDWLAPAHAAAFLSARTSLFRLPAFAKSLAGDLAGFPFDLEEVAAMVSHANGETEMLTLRTLNRILDDAIERERTRRRGDPPIEGLDDAALRARTINLQEIYSEALAESLGETA